jgi:surface antigen
MRLIPVLGMMLACAACQPPSDTTQVAALPGQPQPNQTPPMCHPFRVPVTAAGRQEQASGAACEQPDGSWQVVQNTPGLPAQTYTLEPPGQPPAAPVNLLPQSQPSNSECSSYTAPVSVGGQPRQAAIEACPQPDGSWTITQNTPGLPTQVYQVPPPSTSPYPYGYPYPVDYAYPEFFPYWIGTPWYFGLAPSIVVVQKFQHFKHGFGRGFGHGFARGFGPGLSHGIAVGHGGGRH